MNQVDAVITGATGHIGNEIAHILLSKGKKVRVISRKKENLESLVKKGAEAFVGLLDDKKAMSQAFSGSKAAFIMIPPNMTAPDFRAYQNKISEALAGAVAEAGVSHVVHLSSIGAQIGEKTGPINGLHDSELRFNNLQNVNVVHLRPAYFMENHLMNIGLIKGQQINGTPAAPDVKIPMIATKDIAEVAAHLLELADFSGKIVRELLGGGDYSMKEATKLIGKAIGKPDLPYVQFPYEDAQKAMIGMGISEDLSGQYIEMYKGFNEGIIKSTVPRSAKNTTPTKLEDFTAFFAAIFKSS